MPRTVTDVPFGLRLFVWLTESFGRLAATTVVVGATLRTLELVVLVVLATVVVVVELETVSAASTVVVTAIATVVTGVSAVSTVVVTVATVVTNVSLADRSLAQLEIADTDNTKDIT